MLILMMLKCFSTQQFHEIQQTWFTALSSALMAIVIQGFQEVHIV